MENGLIKYLIIKMILGKGYSATIDELKELETYLKNEGYKINFESKNDFIENKDNYFIANYNLKRETFDINGIKSAEFKLLKSFIDNQKNIEIDFFNEDIINRCKEIYVYLIEILVSSYNNQEMSLEELENVEMIPEDMKKVFNEFSVRSAYLLENDSELLISNEDISQNIKLSYRAFFNNLFVTNNIKSIINKYTNNNHIKYILDFGNGKYYGIPSFKQDMLVIYDSDTALDPIYLPRVKVADQTILNQQYSKIKEARENIKRLKL